MTEEIKKNIQDVEITFKSFIVYWKSWEWKTIFCNLLTDWFIRVYSNVDFFKNKKKINISITSIKDLKKIKFDVTPWIVIIDEAWINASSRNSLSSKNKSFSEFLFLCRKINCRIVWLAQRQKSLDINIRELADVVIRMYKISREWKHPLFIATREKIKNWKPIFYNERFIDIISWMKMEKRSYNTLETSKITK